MKFDEAMKLTEMITQLDPYFAKRHVNKFWVKSREDSENRKKFKYKKRKSKKKKTKKS